MDIERKPVEDFTTDWDHMDSQWTANPYPIWEDMRARCPIAHTDRYNDGAWYPVDYKDIVAIAKNTDDFSSASGIIGQKAFEPAPIGVTPPISSDPPYHKGARDLMMYMFTPKATRAMEDGVRANCNRLLDQMSGKEIIEINADYSQHIPTNVISTLLGLPPEDEAYFLEIIHIVFESIGLPEEERKKSLQPVLKYLVGRMMERKKNPSDDFINTMIQADVSPAHKFGSLLLMIIAGSDTVWSTSSAALWHLAQNPQDLERLVNEPDLMPLAIEEFLRFYAPVSMARIVTQDIEYNGCPMKKDDWVLLSYPAANRDPKVFKDADKFIIDRKNNRHIAFGSGIHRCAGLHSARMQLTVAITEFIKRYPRFELANPESVTWSPGQVRGPRTVPIRIL